jgi:uncharacterized membrane protein YtjA (UPF0391 family)
MATTGVLHNPIWLMWPEILVICVGVACVVGLLSVGGKAARSATAARLVFLLGLIVTFSTAVTCILSASWLYMPIGILQLAAPVAFGVLLIRPAVLARWELLRVYLTACLIASVLVSVAQFLRLYVG